MRNRLPFMFASMLLLCGCLEERPPSGFDPVPATNRQLMRQQCPDLRGSFDLANLPLGSAIADRAPPDTHGLPLLLTFRRGSINTEAWWVVPRDALRRWATGRNISNPASYARWRELVLRESLPGQTLNYRAFQQAVASLGPPGRVYAGSVNFQCKDNWMRIREQPRYPGSQEGDDPRQTEIWLAMDKSGALLVKTLHLTLGYIRIWGDAATSYPTSSQASWSRVEPSPFADASPLTEADLPAARVILAEDGSDAGSSCSDMPARLVEFSNRIKQNLSADVQLAYFVPQSGEPESSLEGCPGKILEIHFAGGNPESLSQLDSQLLRDPLVRNVTVLRSDADKANLRRLKVVLK